MRGRPRGEKSSERDQEVLRFVPVGCVVGENPGGSWERWRQGPVVRAGVLAYCTAHCAVWHAVRKVAYSP